MTVRAETIWIRRSGTLALMAGVLAGLAPTQAPAETTSIERLIRAYPAQLTHIAGDHLVWRDGTRMSLAVPAAPRTREAMLARPALPDIFWDPYPTGWPAPPQDGADPGRARPVAFFDKMYGSCARGEVAGRLRSVRWPGPSGPHVIKVTTVNSVAERLTAVSAEVARLPPAISGQLVPPAGGYNCRPVAGTERASPHGWGIAVDIGLGSADYWLWTKGARPGAPPPWRNRIAPEIVQIFERHGFIWGGRWSHFDTMHFEYRPELLGQPAAP